MNSLLPVSLLPVIAYALLACGTERANLGPDAATPDTGSASDAGAVSDAAASDTGTYHQGVYTCCGPGQGVRCCTADAGLLGYDELPDGAIVATGGRSGGGTEANCFKYGGTGGACTANGDSFDGKDICSLCCDGLSALAPMAPDDAGACTVLTNPISVQTCSPCGNGACDTGENRCNCPADCK